MCLGMFLLYCEHSTYLVGESCPVTPSNILHVGKSKELFFGFFNALLCTHEHKTDQKCIADN